MRNLAEPLQHDQAGFALIEVLMSAIVLMLMAGAILGLIETSARSATEERHKAVAYSFAQEDQSRLRSMQISRLNGLNETRTVTVDGTPYTIESIASFVNDSTGTASCGSGNSTADYVKLKSTVTWSSIGAQTPPTISGIVAPPNGSLDPSHGTLTVSVENGQGLGLGGIGLSGSGAGSFSGVTDSAGCAQFADQAAGNYTLTPSGPPGTVDKDGVTPAPQPVSVVAGTTSTVALQLDQEGSAMISFQTKVGSKFVPSSADSIVAFNTGMTAAKTFGAPGGTLLPSQTARPLFPFSSPDSFYAGACTGNNPNPTGEKNPPGAAAIASLVVPSGGSVAGSIQLPALNVTVWAGTNTVPGLPVAGAHLTVSDNNCVVSGKPVKRTYATTAEGKLADPGLPWSVYDVCVDDGIRRQTAAKVSVENLTSGTNLPLYLSGTGSTLGTCP
jgi:type II secretory pathway pseudopilin PulG